MTAQIQSPFEELLIQDRATTYLEKIVNQQNQLLSNMEKHREDSILISATLPKRGWYLSGNEPCTISNKLAKLIRESKLEEVDNVLMNLLPEFERNTLKTWLVQEKVPDYCINRLFLFLNHRQNNDHESATYLGVPLIDELALHLYNGKAFTTKRGNFRKRRVAQAKPELAFTTTSGPKISSYCKTFIQAFGSLQEDPNQNALSDEDYWNRHAIIHGLMQRPMGIKDSSKCLMAINFLLFAREDADSQES